jgi:F0F1-type ATP synthase assembly protein I
MIKNLLNADEDPLPGIKVLVEEPVIDPPAETSASAPLTAEEPAENFETRPVFEIPEDAKFFAKQPETVEETVPVNETVAEPAPISEISEPVGEPLDDTVTEDSVNLPAPETEAADPSNTRQFADEKTNDDAAPTIFQSAYKPPTTDETVRQSGLAWSAGIVFFGSIVFMLIFGWFADQLLGSAPWGLVGGIVLGAVIGFIQFFRITSQIFRK